MQHLKVATWNFCVTLQTCLETPAFIYYLNTESILIRETISWVYNTVFWTFYFFPLEGKSSACRDLDMTDGPIMSWDGRSEVLRSYSGVSCSCGDRGTGGFPLSCTMPCRCLSVKMTWGWQVVNPSIFFFSWVWCLAAPSATALRRSITERAGRDAVRNPTSVLPD